ncbi:MAG: TolC family protein [Candidatus Latescibacterota bacterium]|nr:MAG: TolC family protein [Candidatus Latescibacterota bacterium]
MFVRYMIALCITGVMGTMGCASHNIGTALPEPRRLGYDIAAFNAPEDASVQEPAGADVEEPTGFLSLGDALALALMKNPELAAFSWEVRAREAEILQAGLRPNPQAAIEIENFVGSGEFDGFGGSETTLGLFQLFELGGKRGNRRSVAEQSRNLAAWDYETKRVDVLTEVTKNFVALLVAQKQAALAGELVNVAEQMLDAVTMRVEAGGTSPVEQGRAQLELHTTRIDLQRAQREVDMTRQRLSAMWGETNPRFAEARGTIETTAPVPPIEEIVVRINHNPDLARWMTEFAQREAIASLERSRRIPDLELGIGIRRIAATDDNALVAELTVPLPIFSRNQGAIRAAERRVAMAREERRASSVKIRTRLTDIYQQLVLSEGELTRLRDEVLPEATTTFESARTAYQRGRMRLTGVLDAQRTLFALRSRYYDALGAYHQGRADIERLIGAPLVEEETR